MSGQKAPFIALDFSRKAESEALASITAFEAELSARRTVREFSTEPVPVALIEHAIRIAASAPSGANQQPWRFVVVRDPDLKRQIREAAEAEEKRNYTERFPEEWLRALEPFGTDWNKPFLEDAPCLIVVFRIDYGVTATGEKIKHYYVSESVGIATGFLLAALHKAGLATLTHTPNPMAFLSRILNRPSNERPFLLIPVGYPAASARVPNIAKKPLEDVMVLL